MSQQDEKSQIKNRAKAMKVLRSRLYEMEMRKQQDAIAKDRRSQVGTGERSEKIRTYNFPQNRITDHRINFTTHQLTGVLDGDLDELIDAVTSFYQAREAEGRDRTAELDDYRRRRRPQPKGDLRLGGPRVFPDIHDVSARPRRGLSPPASPNRDAAIDADVLARHVLGWTREQMLVASARSAAPRSESFAAALQRPDCPPRRRANRSPTSPVTASSGARFEVTRDVLIPRPKPN